MASKKKKEGSKKTFGLQLKDETKQSIYAVIFFLFALFTILAPFKIAGVAGDTVYKAFFSLFGFGYYLIPVGLGIVGATLIEITEPEFFRNRIVGLILFLVSGLGMFELAIKDAGGILGRVIAYPFFRLFGVYVGILFLGGILLTSLFILFDKQPNLRGLWERIANFFSSKESDDEYEDESEEHEEHIEAAIPPEASPAEASGEEAEPLITHGVNDENIPMNESRQQKYSHAYVPPPLSLLSRDKGKPDVGDIKANSNIIKRTLQNFGIEVEMDEITIGPTVTRYALKPAEGVKLSRIVGLQNDIALALAAHPIRIQAPIPGKSLVGIEIPNRVKTTVGLGNILSGEEFQDSDKRLLVALGKGISGKSILTNLAKMPHLLIAGATGSGKSVSVHALIASLLYRNGPEDLRFIMVDPKRVELTLYNNIPHLLTPVIKEPKQAILALKWAAKEMERRYDVLESIRVRDIQSYHSKYEEDSHANTPEALERMPYIVIVIDELADIMQSYPRELEAAIVRLAQMSRAVGIHLVLSTQRPSVNVITGLIKANVPARVALQVSSQIDSRTILDQGGAEKLLGAGDMLFMSGDMPQPERIQGAFIHENEVKKIAKYLTDSYKDEVPDEINLSPGSISSDTSIFTSTLDDDADDDMYEEARAVVMEAGKASTSYLQRKLKVGYSRAARLMDILEERGVIGPQSGSKPRDVYGAESNGTPSEINTDHENNPNEF